MSFDGYKRKLERQEKVQLGRLNDDWLNKIGHDFFESEKREILRSLETAMLSELPGVQARYKELMALKHRLASITNDGKKSERKIHEENRREQE